jgi:hypothetical protein
VHDATTRGQFLQFDLRQEDIWTMAQRVQRLDGSVANDAWNLRKQATAWLSGPTGHLLWYHIAGAPFNTLGGYLGTNAARNYVEGSVDAPMSVFRAMIGRPRPQVRKYSAKFNTKYDLSGITENNILKNMSVGGSLRWTDKGSIGFYGLGYDPAKDL